MIEVSPGQPDGILELKVTGTVTSADYDQVLIPAVEAAREKSTRIRVLSQLGPDFEGWQGLGALADHLSVVRDHGKVDEAGAGLGSTADGVQSRGDRTELGFRDRAVDSWTSAPPSAGA